MSKKFAAVIFDLDGTLIDSMGIWRQVDTDFLEKRGLAVPDDLFYNLPQGNSFIQTAQYFKDRFQLSDSVETIMAEWTQMVENHYRHDTPLKEGAAELIEWLSEQGIKIGMGTSNSYQLAEAALTQHNLLHHFITVVSGCMNLRGKPFPDIYLRTAGNMAVNPEECIVIEDTLSGIRAAKAGGMYAIALYDDDSKSDWKEISQTADFAFYSYRQITNHLKSILGLSG